MGGSVLLAWGDAIDIGWGRGRLAPAAAASLARVDAAVWGRIGRVLDIIEAWRSPETADKNYRDYQAYLAGGPWAPIGLPASQSIHCRGYAIDTDDSWMLLLLNEHGWFQTVFRNGVLVEPWHFEYDPARDQHRNEPAGGGATPFEEDDMPYTQAQIEEMVANGVFQFFENTDAPRPGPGWKFGRELAKMVWNHLLPVQGPTGDFVPDKSDAASALLASSSARGVAATAKLDALTVSITAADIAAIAKAVAAALPASTGGPSLEQVQQVVASELGKLTLKAG